MPRFNRTFELTINDIEMIEASLRDTARHLSSARIDASQDGAVDLAQVAEIDNKARRLHDLLGRLHNQKVFYRPAEGTYVGG